MNGNKASQYLRSLADVTISAIGVTASFIKGYNGKFDGTKEKTFSKLRVLLAPRDLKPAGIPADVWFEKGQTLKGDQGGRISWFFRPCKKAHHVALSFYTNMVCGECLGDSDQWFQFKDGDHMYDFQKLLDITGIEPGISDYEIKTKKMGELRQRLFPIAFGVNPDYESADDAARSRDANADKVKAALAVFQATAGGWL